MEKGPLTRSELDKFNNVSMDESTAMVWKYGRAYLFALLSGLNLKMVHDLYETYYVPIAHNSFIGVHRTGNRLFRWRRWFPFSNQFTQPDSCGLHGMWWFKSRRKAMAIAKEPGINIMPTGRRHCHIRWYRESAWWCRSKLVIASSDKLHTFYYDNEIDFELIGPIFIINLELSKVHHGVRLL